MATSQSVDISCVIPCYCSSRTIEKVLLEIEETMNTAPSYSYEVILVNDGSPDEGATARKIIQLAEEYEHVKAVDLARNFGQHSAIMAGFSYVSGEIVVCLDDDGQTPPNEMFKLIHKVEEGYDIVYASYGANKRHNAFRRVGSKFNRWTNQHFMGIPKDLEETSYFATKRYVVESALSYKNPYPFVEGLLFQAVDTYCNVPVVHREREIGQSGYSLRKLVGLWSNGFTAFSVYPLRAATILGSLFSLVGFIAAIIVIVQKLLDLSVNEGWSSTMAAMLFIGGLIMLLLGLVGEYVGRIYMSINNSPQYVVRRTVGLDQKSNRSFNR